MQSHYKISNLLAANDILLKNDVYLVLLYATRVPPHLLISVNGKIFTLNVTGASVDGELDALLKLIRKKQIETIFIRLTLPALFTLDNLKKEIRSCTLAYPRVDIGIATCLTPINDFCHTIYNTDKKNVNLIFDLLPRLKQVNAMRDCYQMNLDHRISAEKEINSNFFELKLYQVNDVHEAIRAKSLAMS